MTLRLAAWNALFVIAGLLLIAVVGEIYLRLANPALEADIPFHFVDGVGLIREPNAELRYANWDAGSFVVSRANSLGFLDREPVSAERAAAGCHIAFIGDSFVEARQVPIADKFHVRMEEMAARELPHLDITTQAYGISATGQIAQLPFYDEYARRLSPNLIILVFHINDFFNNSVALHSLQYGLDPDRMPYMSAYRDENGTLKLRPPDPEYKRFLLPRLPKPWRDRAWNRLTGISYLAKWMDKKDLWRYGSYRQLQAWMDMLAERPCCALLDKVYRPSQFKEESLPPALEEGLEYTAFGIEQFKRRADRDGARLAIMATPVYMGSRGDPQFERLSAIAEALGIPIISDHAYNIWYEHDPWEGILRIDGHWNPTGHQWVAAAVLEWLKANRGVCD